MTTGVPSPAYGLPPEECVLLICSYIDSLILAASSLPSPQSQENPQQLRPPTAPQDADQIGHKAHIEHTIDTHKNECPSTSGMPRRSLDYVADRPNGTVTHVLGPEFGVGVGYGEVDMKRQKQRLALRFKSKEVPKISVFDYLERYRSRTRLLQFLFLLHCRSRSGGSRFCTCSEFGRLTPQDTEV